MGDNKVFGGFIFLMLGVFLGVFSSMFYGYEDLFGLYEKVFLLDVMNGIVVEKDNFKIKGINC